EGVRSPIANGKVRKNTCSILIALKGYNREPGGCSSVDDGAGRAAGAGNRDGFALEVDVFLVSARGDENRVAILGCVDAGLDSSVGLAGADLDRCLCQGCRGDQR